MHVIFSFLGWIGWGLSVSGQMKGADMIIGWIDSQGNKHFTDRHAMGHRIPLIDKHQDYNLISMFEKYGSTTIVFSRKINLCNDDDFRINGNTMRVLYAWNDADPLQNKFINQHTKRGSKSVFLLDFADNAKQPLPKSHKKVEFVMNNITLPGQVTSYWCKGFVLPRMVGKHHLIHIEHVITPGNEEYVHHMLLYQCEYVADTGAHTGHPCMAALSMPEIQCRREIVVHGWAVGGTTFYYPKDVGFSLNDRDDPKYFLLEIHYNNQNKLKNIVDSSGVRLVYTDLLRKHDASVLLSGVSPDINGESQIIPQNQKEFTTYGYCHSKCLNITPPVRRYIFSVGLHTHIAGRRVVVRLVRDKDGVEVKRIAEDLNYDFNFQEARMLKNPIEIPPEHSIHVECTYNTENRQSPVLGGLGTHEEMCFAFLFIYPKLNTRMCFSRPTAPYTWGKEKFNWMIGQHFELFSSVVVGGKDYRMQLANEPLKQREFWMKYPYMIKDFQNAIERGPYFRLCSHVNGKSLYSDFSRLQLSQSRVTKKLPQEACPKLSDTDLTRPVVVDAGSATLVDQGTGSDSSTTRGTIASILMLLLLSIISQSN